MRPPSSVSWSETSSLPRKSPTLMPAPGSPASVSRMWVEITGASFQCQARLRSSHAFPHAPGSLQCLAPLREPPGLDAVLAGDLGLVSAHEMAVADDLLAADVEAVDSVRGG